MIVIHILNYLNAANYEQVIVNFFCIIFSDSNNQRLMLGDSSIIPVPGSKGPLKPQGTINSVKQLRIDHKK